MAGVRQDATGSGDGGVDDWVSPDDPQLGEWEEQSVPLQVPVSYREEFDVLREYVAAEMEELRDDSLQQGLEILDLLTDPSAIEEARSSSS